MNQSIIKQIKISPKTPGIYTFKTKRGQFLYIGKAANLRNRLKQYSNKKTESPFLEHLINEAEKVETKTTSSEIEALILESKLIKENQPKYNIMLRDDKQYFYVVFTNEEFARIFLTHQPNSKYRNIEISDFIGPFTDGAALKTTLRLLRKIFPYCTCKQKHNNFCLNYHIGKCLGYCCLKNNPELVERAARKDYKNNIKSIKGLLEGKKKSVLINLKRILRELGEEGRFEEAIELRNKIEKLEKIFENAKIISNTSKEYARNRDLLAKMKQIFSLPERPRRIESYDISNIQGKNATGAMAVFTEAKPDPEGATALRPYGASKKEYRKFKIIFKDTPDDIAMLKEVLSRRLKHPEWPFPDLIFIDGGIAQINIASKTTKDKFPIISLAKGKQEIFSNKTKKPIPVKDLPTEIQNFIKLIDSEAHRFAITYYRKIHRKKTFK